MAEWDALSASERDWWITRHERERSTHQGCGHAQDVCSDPKLLWYPQRSICYATREKEAALAKWHALHAPDTGRVWHNGDESSWSKDRDDGHPYRYDMGTTIWVARRDVNPDDRFLSGAQQSEPDDAGDEGQPGHQ